jgi:K(+)-stimulated pyrophosphate-energized sodium pump
MDLFYLTTISAGIALIYVVIQFFRIKSKDPGTPKMVEISKAIREGAFAYLKRQYVGISSFFAIVFVVLLLLSFRGMVSRFMPFAFLTSGFFSALAGFLGMNIATLANVRTTNAARESLNKALRISFTSGTVMGLSVVSFAVVDLSIWYTLIRYVFHITDLKEIALTMVAFGLGASSQALFARVGGGIYTKAADVGADLVGKVEAGIPEDDPRNPAVIADNVGDNVGDVAGMGADLYESYYNSIIASIALGVGALANVQRGFLIPVMIAGIGILASLVSTSFVRVKEGADQHSLLWALRKGSWMASLLIAIASYFVFMWLAPNNISLWGSLISGILAGIFIGQFSEYYTSATYKPTKGISKSATTGSATVVIEGLSVGMKSTFYPVITVAIAMYFSYGFASGFDFSLNFNKLMIGQFPHALNMGLFGIGIAAIGMLSTLGITLSTDAYGPIADNAGGIAEMAGLDKEVRRRTDALDSLGNTTAATGKGFAIGSAALTTMALISSFANKINDISNNTIPIAVTSFMRVDVLVGLFVGAMLPFLFSSMAMQAVGRAAEKMVDEVRRQFRDIPGLLAGKGKPDYASCVIISTKSAQKEMILPGVLAILSPILVGVFLGPYSILALLMGAMVSGFTLAVFMANAGGAWDNAKKYIEEDHYGGKGSEAHRASIVGDTIGDPLKDTAGPSLNILIKLMSTVSLTFASLFLLLYRG